jgi:hypothetical protein
MQNLGAGMDDEDKSPGMFEIEKQLQFLRFSNEKGGPQDFDLIRISEESKHFSIKLALHPRKNVAIKLASTKPLEIKNESNKNKVLKLVSRST